MTAAEFLGEFEQMVLLAILQSGTEANAVAIRRELENSANRTVSRGAFYTTLDRLERKGYVTWEARLAVKRRRDQPERHFQVTPAGVSALKRSREALFNLWRDLDATLGAG